VAILRDLSQRLGRQISITAMDWTDPRDPYVTGPDIEVRDLNSRTLANPHGYLAIARHSDLVIDIGGGDSFTDIYRRRRLAWMLALKFLTRLSGTPLVMAPQTIGPFRRPLSKRLARWSMTRAVVVAARDDLSIKAAREMGVTREIIAASDVALRLPFDPPNPRASNDPLRVGLNVSGLLMNGGYSGKNEFSLAFDYPALMRRLIRFFLDRPEGCELHLVPHVLARNDGETHLEDDAQANWVLAQEFPDVIEAPRFSNPSAAKSYIAGLDFFLGARMHACIAAFSAGVPVVPMAYSRKFEGLFGALGYHRTVDCRSESADEIMAKVAHALAERQALRAEIGSALEIGHARLNRYVDSLEGMLLGV
jgi:polysaccharide pyruvyl transferase WcaK-like protein